MAGQFSDAQRVEMASIIAQAMSIYNDNRRNNPPTPQPTPSSSEHAWRARDLEYFEPNPDLPPVESKDNYNTYHNVLSFTNRLRVKATTMDTSHLRRQFDKCLLGSADTWFTEELTRLSRSGLQNDPDGVTQWCSAFEERFRESPLRSLDLLEKLRYTIQDVRIRRDRADYVASIILSGKNAGKATTEAAQAKIVFNYLDAQ